MPIPEELKRRLLSELDFVIRMITEETETTRKMYFLSAAHGAIERTIRFHDNSELMIAHAILNICFNALLDRANRIKGGDTAVPLPDNWSERISEDLRELRRLIDEDHPLYPALERIMRLAYTISGPGHYTLSYLEFLRSS